MKEVLIAQALRFAVIDQQKIKAPGLTGAEFAFVLNSSASLVPRVRITGVDFLQNNPWSNPSAGRTLTLGSHLADIYVTFEIGGRDTFDFQGHVLAVGGRDVKVAGSDLTMGTDVVNDNTVTYSMCGCRTASASATRSSR